MCPASTSIPSLIWTAQPGRKQHVEPVSEPPQPEPERGLQPKPPFIKVLAPFIMPPSPLWQLIDWCNGFYRLFISLLQQWIDTTSLRAWAKGLAGDRHITQRFWMVISVTYCRNKNICVSMPDAVISVGYCVDNNALELLTSPVA